MKILLDANISWRLCSSLSSYFTECKHVDFIELPTPLSDIQIWEYALQNGYIIVTNDEDFLNMINIKKFPPRVVLLKTGNQSTSYIGKLLIEHKEDIAALEHSNEYGLIEIY